jgi:hypothetical protein
MRDVECGIIPTGESKRKNAGSAIKLSNFPIAQNFLKSVQQKKQ